MTLTPDGDRHTGGPGSPLAGVVLLLALSALIMLRQLFSPYYYSCIISDSWQYSSWAWQFKEALKEGVCYPAWTPLNFWGYGSPTFILYPPLAFFITAFFERFSDSLIFGMNMTKFLSLFIGSVGAYFFARDMYGERVGRLTGSLYAVFPYYVTGLYIGGGFPSAVSLMWFPLIILFSQKFVRSGRAAHLLYAGGAYGGLVLTHLINAYMFTFVIVGYFAYMAVARRKMALLTGIPAVLITGACVSAAYLLPFLHGKEYINYRSIAQNFPYSDYFLFPKHKGLVAAETLWRYYYSEYAAYALCFLTVTILLLARLGRSRSGAVIRDGVPVNRFFAAVSILSIFLLCEPSTFLWETIPFFKFVNIAVRWLNITAFAVVLLMAGEFSVIESGLIPKTKRLMIYSIIFISCLAGDYGYISSSCFFARSELVPAKDVNWLPEHLPADAVAAEAEEAGGEKLSIEGNGSAQILAWKSAQRSLVTQSNGPLLIEVRTFYFPGWKAYVDGDEVNIGVKSGKGAMIVKAPPGRHRVDMVFQDSRARRVGKAITLASIAIIAGAILGGRFRRAGEALR
jgi:hypothetical protein